MLLTGVLLRLRFDFSAHLLAVDACAAAVVAAGYVALAGQDASDGLPRFSGPSWLGWLVAVCVEAPVAARRHVAPAGPGRGAERFRGGLPKR
ncbi:hypothetical protein ABZ885_39735, partial [Kitasatospora sp. NPDC047058]